MTAPTPDDRIPDGDPIETHTLWLDFADEGEAAITLDLTRFNAAMRRAAETCKRAQS